MGFFGLSSLLNLPAFITFRPEFRKGLLRNFGCRRNRRECKPWTRTENSRTIITVTNMRNTQNQFTIGE